MFRVASEVVGDRLRRIPDGETGDRILYTVYQAELLSKHPQFEAAQDPQDWRPHARVLLRNGVRAEDVRLDDLGYVEPAMYQGLKIDL